MKANPTPRLLIGFVAILILVGLYSTFTLRQVSSLRKLQSDMVARNRKDTLQLLRIQDTLNSIGLALHDVLEEPYGVVGFEAQFRRLRAQLDDAIQREASFSRNPEGDANRRLLRTMLAKFGSATDEMFAQARAHHEKRAVDLIRGTLRPQQAALSASVARMLVQNSELDRQTEIEIARIYDRVERDLFGFFFAVLAAIVLTGGALVASNRRLFRQVATLSEQKSTLAQKLISVQEEVLRSVSRELHDEFGQIFTAIGAMLSRLQRKGVPADSPLQTELSEIRDITQEALDKVRSLSHMLHPSVLDDYGLEKAVEWYVPMFEKQTGIHVQYERTGTGPPIRDETAIHVYRILQEALNNVARHAGVKRANVRVHYSPDCLRLEVEDAGKGFQERSNERTGLGLVGMRERAELLHGRLKFLNPPQGGTLVSLEVPISHES